MNYNEILGVSQNAPATEIKQAFRKAAKEHHPDHSDSPEAAEAFKRIKLAHDELLKQARASENIDTVQASTTAAASATAQAAYSNDDDTADHLTEKPQKPQPDISPEELARIQKLDQEASKYVKRFSFNGRKQSPDVLRHRKKIRTTNDRIVGKY